MFHIVFINPCKHIYMHLPVHAFIITELTVQFSHIAYTGSERSGTIPVTLLLGGGTLANEITVTVIPSDQSPLSAEGMFASVYFISQLVCGCSLVNR